MGRAQRSPPSPQRMKRSTLIVVPILLASMAAALVLLKFQRSQTLGLRIQKSIAAVASEATLVPDTELAQDYLSLQAFLNGATSADLERPRLAAAFALTDRRPDKETIVVVWTESAPTATAIRLIAGVDAVLLPFNETSLRGLQAESTELCVYFQDVSTTASSELEKLRRILHSDERVALLIAKDGSLSNYVPVRLIPPRRQ